MAIGFIVGFVLFVLMGAAIIGAVRSWLSESSIGVIVCAILAVVLLLAFIIVPFSFHTINTGEIAVVRHLGAITHTRSAGTNFDLWVLNSYEKYDTKVQNVDIAAAAYSSDAQTMEITMTLQYQIMPDKVIDIATQYGSLEVLQNRIQSIAIEKTKSVLSSYKAMDIIAQRSQISPAVEQAIKDAIGNEYFVKVNTVVLTNIDFSDAFEVAVEEKMIAEQAKLTADYENEKKVALAEAEAAAKLKEAEAQKAIAAAEAEALLIKAEAEAEANRIITESITPELLNKIIAENWNGELPDTVVGDENGLGLILPSNP